MALSGAVLGLIVGVALCWLQQKYEMVSMGMTSSLVDAYPVRLVWGDVLLTALIIVLITIAMSFIPARRAAQAVNTSLLG